MKTVAKLFVSKIERNASNPDQATIHFGAVTRGEANKVWADASPSASFQMTINNPEAVAQFQLRQEYYVTFEQAEVIPTLGDGHEFEGGDSQWSENTCQLCGCRKISHEPGMRERIVALAGIRPAGPRSKPPRVAIAPGDLIWCNGCSERVPLALSADYRMLPGIAGQGKGRSVGLVGDCSEGTVSQFAGFPIGLRGRWCRYHPRSWWRGIFSARS